MRNKKICNLALSYGRIAKIPAQLSYGLMNSAMFRYHVPQIVFLVCFSVYQSWCSASIACYSTILLSMMTARIKCHSSHILFLIFCFQIPRDHRYRGSKKIIIQCKFVKRQCLKQNLKPYVLYYYISERIGFFANHLLL